MNRQEIFDQVHGVFKTVFDDPELTLTRETSAADIPGWDSLNHITLIAMIEEELKVRFNVGEMLDLIAKKLEGRN